MERLVGRVHERRRLANHQPEDPVSAVAGGADRQGRRPGADVGARPPISSATCGPQVRSVTVHPPGIVFQKPYSTGEPDLAGFEDQTTPERKLAVAAAQQGRLERASAGVPTQKGLETLQWRADDENDDELVYDVLFRREGETTWKTLRRAVAETILVWDTNTVPNGTYFVKVVASDGPSNPAGIALTGELESAAFDIDNTPPAITVTRRARRSRPWRRTGTHGRHLRRQGRSFADSARRVFRGRPAVARRVPDRRHRRFTQEHYELTVDGVLTERGLTLRAADSMNNVETGHVERAGRSGKPSGDDAAGRGTPERRGLRRRSRRLRARADLAAGSMQVDRRLLGRADGFRRATIRTISPDSSVGCGIRAGAGDACRAALRSTSA